MSIRIGAHTMRSNATKHHAEATGDRWRVSFLPGRELTRNQAITAMTLAETVATRALFAEDPIWVHIDNWAAELGLTGPEAVVRASEPVGGAS